MMIVHTWYIRRRVGLCLAYKRSLRVFIVLRELASITRFFSWYVHALQLYTCFCDVCYESCNADRSRYLLVKIFYDSARTQQSTVASAVLTGRTPIRTSISVLCKSRLSVENSSGQEAQLSQRGRAILYAIEYFDKSLKVIRSDTF